MQIKNRITGANITSGEVVIQFKNRNGQLLPNGTYNATPVSGIQGLWRTIIPATFTSSLQPQQTYIMTVQITTTDGVLYCEQPIKAVIHVLS